MKEIWKDIAGYEGLYQVSNFGNVRSLNYRRHGYVKQLTPKVNNKGYLWVSLGNRRKENPKPMLIHRLVAIAFVENSMNYPIVNHKDENPLNNNAENLEWCNVIYNVNYSLDRHPERRMRHNFIPSEKYRKHDKKLLQYDKDMKLINIYESVKACAKEHEMNEWSIIQCCYGKRKTAYGYKWRFAE